MGVKTSQKDSLTLLKEKDDQITQLETQVQLYIIQRSHLRTRLIATLDTLDALKTSHNFQLASETHAKEQLSRKLDRYIDFVQDAEAERDDLRDAVNQLVEKVQLHSDYSLWPHSRITSTSLTEPYTSPPNTKVNDSDKQLQAYATAIINTLRIERDLERKAHEKTRQNDEFRIIELEAQLARREAELEACRCAVHGGDSLDQRRHRVYSSRDRETIKVDSHPTPRITKDEAIKIMDITSTKNKLLELEVQGLAKRLNNARQQAALPSTSRGPGHDGRQLPDHLDPRPSPSGTRYIPRAQESSSDSQTFQEENAAAVHDRHYVPLSPSTHNLPRPILALDDRIQALTSELDAFKSEKELLAKLITNTSQINPAGSSPGGSQFGRVLLIEEECIRLEKSERSARTDLETFKRSAAALENELQQEIDRLRQLMHASSPVRHFDNTALTLGEQYDYCQSQDRLHSPNDDEPADLNIPFRPSVIDPPSTPPEPTDRSSIDPLSIPLPSSRSPPSPSPLISFTLLPQVHESSLLTPNFKEAQIERMEIELREARRDLETKQGELNDLLATVENLRAQVTARHPVLEDT